MRFKADENLPAEVAALLRDSGHDAVSVLDQHLGGGSPTCAGRSGERSLRSIWTLRISGTIRRKSTPASSCSG